MMALATLFGSSSKKREGGFLCQQKKENSMEKSRGAED